MAEGEGGQHQRIGHGTDIAENAAPGGGATPAEEPRGQDTAGPQRGIGFWATLGLGLLLLAVPIVWAVTYLQRAGETGQGGFASVVGVVLALALAFGLFLLWRLLRGQA